MSIEKICEMTAAIALGHRIILGSLAALFFEILRALPFTSFHGLTGESIFSLTLPSPKGRGERVAADGTTKRHNSRGSGEK
jgi:hypothetical protein